MEWWLMLREDNEVPDYPEGTSEQNWREDRQ